MYLDVPIQMNVWLCNNYIILCKRSYVRKYIKRKYLRDIRRKKSNN